MANFLQKQLIADQYVNLGQAGTSTEEKTRLALVFVDLPATDERQTEPPNEGIDPGGRLPPGFVAAAIKEASQLLDPETLRERNDERRWAAPEPAEWSGPKPGHYVLLGGPGQGKTTISQYLCQLYRVAILESRQNTLTTEAQRAIQAIRLQCQREVSSCRAFGATPSALSSAIWRRCCQTGLRILSWTTSSE